MALIPMPDGRQLEIAVSGPAGGMPLVFHHGTPGAASQGRGVQRAVHERGLRLVTFSRPGYGESTRLPGRSVADAAADVAAVLDHLEAPRCLTVGHSGGGPHALATAALLPERVAGVVAASSFAPYDAPGLDFLDGMGELNLEEFGHSVRGEEALSAFTEAEAVQMRGPDGAAVLRDLLATVLSEEDRAALGTELAEDIAGSFAHGLRHGSHGWTDDSLAFVKPWGFAVETLSVPCFLWQGTEDFMVPPAHGRWLADHIHATAAHIERGEGHLEIYVRGLGPMLDELIAAV